MEKIIGNLFGRKKASHPWLPNETLYLHIRPLFLLLNATLYSMPMQYCLKLSSLFITKQKNK